MGKKEKLKLFAEYACYSTASGPVFPDPSHPNNVERASEWLKKELTFLGKRDEDELKQVWNQAINDGRDIKMLFTAVKVLQDKYS